VASLSHKRLEINREKQDFSAGKSVDTATPWDLAVVDYADAQDASERARRWWQAVPSHIADIPKTADWAVAAFAIGCGLYFALPFEPNLAVCAVISVVGLLAWMIATKWQWQSLPLLLVIFASLGLTRASWHSKAVNTPFLDEGFYTVTGWVEAQERSGTGIRWRIRVHDIEGRNAPESVHSVRIKINKRGENPDVGQVGQGVRLQAILSAPPGPVVPGGYDPARAAYFSRISAYGFSTSAPEAVMLESRNWQESQARRIARFRYGLAERIRVQAPEATAGLQVALLTGIRSYIPDAQTDALRAAGLAHVLAISGLHMGLLAGGAYALSSLFLAMIGPLARRYDMRKFAAVIGALSATGYLILSGGSVATQRAYIMALIVFLAVILDRRAFSIRSVSIAALITLTLHPEALISAGFQMSFAAVIALVIVYRNWQGPLYERRTIGSRFTTGLATLSITSFVAGTATAAYAVMHFNRMASYGFIGNLLAMPIFTFAVMPAALATLIAMPFGLEWAPLQVMGASLSLLLWVAEWVAGWSSAMVHIKSPPNWIVAVYSLGFLWLCLGEKSLKLMSLAVFTVCLIAWGLNPTPDMRVSDDGRIAIWDSEARDTLYVGSNRADRYGREQFTRRAGTAEVETQSYADTFALCDALACRLKISGKSVSIVSHPSEVPEECRHSDLIVLTERDAGPVAKRGCKAQIIGPRELKTNGAYDIYLGGKTIKAVQAIPKSRKTRPWGVETYRRD
jgi:competence protein ComEC